MTIEIYMGIPNYKFAVMFCQSLIVPPPCISELSQGNGLCIIRTDLRNQKSRISIAILAQASASARAW